jgi:hypothetical protein
MWGLRINTHRTWLKESSILVTIIIITDSSPQKIKCLRYEAANVQSREIKWENREDKFLNILLSITNKMQRYTIFFITVNALHVSGGSSSHHQELKTVPTASGICQACLLLLLAWHIPDAVCTVLSSWWWAEKPPETRRALTAIKNIV